MPTNLNPAGLSRRAFLATLPAAAAAPLLFAKPPQPLGVELYTVRSIIGKQPDQVLKAIADIGYTEVEGYNRAQMIEFMPIIHKYKLRASSCHVETPLITGNWEHYGNLKKASLEEAIEWVKRCPNPTGEESEIEIRQVFAPEDFGAEFTPELQAQEERLRQQLS